MDASPHDVLHPTFENRKGMVVREGGIVNKQDKPVRGINWAAIFKERPELNPPHYDALLRKIREEARYTEDNPPAYNKNAR